MDYNYGGYTAPAGVNSREQVRQMQRQLGVTADGLWGPKTQAAYEKSQQQNMANGYQQAAYVAPAFDYSTTDLDALQRQIYSKLTVPTISYDMPTKQEIAAEISAYLRPSYDQAIDRRKKQTLYNRAEIDADAASRGMGRSSYVTDVKDQAMDAEASDISSLESNYNASLLEGVMNQYNQHLQNKLAADQYNASAQTAAQQAALDYAMGLYGNNLATKAEQEAMAAKGRGGGDENSDISRLLFTAPLSSDVTETDGIEEPEETYTDWTQLIKDADYASRREILYGTTERGKNLKDQLVKDLGEDALIRYQRHYG